MNINGNPPLDTVFYPPATAPLPSEIAPFSGSESIFAPLTGSVKDAYLQPQRGVRRLGLFTTVAATTATLGANGTLTDDTAEPFIGVSALRLTTTTAEVQTIRTLEGVPVDTTDGFIRLWVNCPSDVSPTVLSSLYVDLYSAGTPASPGSDFTSTGAPTNASPVMFRDQLNRMKGGGWYGYAIPMSNFSVASGAGANLAAVTHAAIRIGSNGGGATISVRLGAIDWVPNGRTKAVAVLTFDGRYASHHDLAAPIMARYGFRGVIYPHFMTTIGTADAAYMTIEQMKRLHDLHNWQIASRSYGPESASPTDPSDIVQAAAWSNLRHVQAAYGLTGGDHNSYYTDTSTFGPSNAARMRILRLFGKTGRQFMLPGGALTIVPFVHGETFPFGDPFMIRSFSAGQYNAATNGPQSVLHAEQAITNKGAAVYTWHAITSGDFREAGLQELCEFLDANRADIEVLTFQDLAAQW